MLNTPWYLIFKIYKLKLDKVQKMCLGIPLYDYDSFDDFRTIKI